MTLRPKHLAECQIWKQLREQGAQPSPNSTVSPKDIDWHRAHSLLVRASWVPAGSSYPNLPCLGPHPCVFYPWVWELHLRPDLAPLSFYEPCRGACIKLSWVLLFSWAVCSLVSLLVWWCGWIADLFLKFLDLSAFLAWVPWDCTIVGANKTQKMMSWKALSLNRCVWRGGRNWVEKCVQRTWIFNY